MAFQTRTKKYRLCVIFVGKEIELFRGMSKGAMKRRKRNSITVMENKTT